MTKCWLSMGRVLRVAMVAWLAMQALNAAPPLITSVSPRRGGPGTRVTITGNNFNNPAITRVEFDNQEAQIVARPSSSQIIVIVPPDALTGPIFVFNDHGQDQTGGNFQVPPRITEFFRASPLPTSPTDRIRGLPGQLLQVNGANFDDFSDPSFVTRVYIDGVQATVDTGQTFGGTVVALIPNGARTGPISVATFSGSTLIGSNVTTTNFFLPPVIQSFTTRGRVGDTIDIFGTSLRGVSSVRFGETPATSFAVVSSTNVTAVVPTGAALSGPISVTSIGGTWITTAEFLVAPRIDSLSPAGGPPGTNVTLRGLALQGTSDVRFNGLRAARIVSVTATQVVAELPAAAVSGPVTLTTPNGSDTNTPGFVVTPRITSFQPGVVLVGAEVTVRGANFGSADFGRITSVTIGTPPVEAPFEIVDSGQLVVTVPENARTGRIRITNAGGTAQTTSDLTIAGQEPLLTAFTPEFGPVGTRVTITGINLNAVARVRFGSAATTNFTVGATNLSVTVPQGALTGPIALESPLGTNRSARNFTVGAAARLSVDLPQASTSAIEGGVVSWQIIVDNAGPLPATAAQATFIWPEGLELVPSGVDASRGTFETTPRSVVFQIGTLASQGQLVAAVRLRATRVGQFQVSLSAESDTLDDQPDDNATQSPLTVTGLRLDIERRPSNRVALSWPSFVTNVVLESIGSLSTTNWTAAPGAPVSAGDNVEQVVPATNAAGYFRLRRR
jgi:hypothetical protein